MSRYLLILVMLTASFTASVSFGQQSNVRDSLETRLHLVEDNEKASVLISLIAQTQRDSPDAAWNYAAQAQELLKIHPDRELESRLLIHIGTLHLYKRDLTAAFEYSQQAETIAVQISFGEGIARAKLLQGRLYRENGEYDQAIAVLDSAAVIAENIDSDSLLSIILNEAGTVYRRKGDSNNALNAHTRALELILQTDDKVSISTTYNFLGIIHDIIGNFDQALRYQMLALEVQEELNNRRGMATSMTNIGTLHLRIGQYEEAMVFFEKSLPIWKEFGLQNEIAATMNNIGAVQESLGNYETARGYFEQALMIWSELENLYSVSIALENLGSIYLYSGEYEKASAFKKASLDNHRMLGNKRGISNSLVNLASVYMKAMQPDSALVFAEEGLQIALETESWSAIKNAHEIMAEIHENMGTFEQALYHQKLFKAAHDTLFNSDSQTIIAEFQEQYRTRQQRQQIELLESERELQRMWFVMLTGGFFIVIMVSGLMYNRYKLKVRHHLTQEELHLAEIEKARLHADTVEARTKLLDAEHKRKSEELESARELQLSMLPSVLPENDYAAIAAKMITATEVGGDYYDIEISEDGALTLCIGDATGHGAKAGTLVTVMKGLFKLMAQEDNLICIMHRCSAAIKKMQLPKLYMTFALARLRGTTLELTGAGMPPALIYRAATGTVESIELKGMPLGSVPDYPYIKHTVSLNRHDVVLLMSDGYPELIGSGGDMIGYNSAANILAESGEKDPEAIIMQFSDLALEWTQAAPPNDDMTFLVIKMK